MKKYIVASALVILISSIPGYCFAVPCECDDWMEKGGYCVDYVKSRIPIFPIPQNKDDMEKLTNATISEITEGDVAIYTISNYWHVAYVEKVHRNHRGEAVTIDVSEMNFGDEPTFAEFRKKWKSRSEAEWNRAICCGVTDNYDKVSVRKNVALSSVKQIWSPDNVVPEGTGERRVKAIVGKVKEVLNRVLEFTGKEL